MLFFCWISLSLASCMSNHRISQHLEKNLCINFWAFPLQFLPVLRLCAPSLIHFGSSSTWSPGLLCPMLGLTSCSVPWLGKCPGGGGGRGRRNVYTEMILGNPTWVSYSMMPPNHLVKRLWLFLVVGLVWYKLFHGWNWKSRLIIQVAELFLLDL